MLTFQLHNYPMVLRTARRDEIGMLMRETGMSILLTSVNNILSFMTGIILPIPALRSFCTQVRMGGLFLALVCNRLSP